MVFSNVELINYGRATLKRIKRKPPLRGFESRPRERAPLNSEGESIRLSVRLTSLYLLIRNWLHQEKLRFFFQSNLILTSKDEAVSRTDMSGLFARKSEGDLEHIPVLNNRLAG